MTLPDISAYLHTKDGFCHPDWDKIEAVIESNIPKSDWHAAWESASRLWAEQNARILGSDYQVHETPNFLILSEAPTRVTRNACKSFENSRKEIFEILAGVLSDEGYGKFAVMMFGSMNDYFSYITRFYPDGEHPMTGGLCLNSEGYTHFAFPTTDYSSYHSIFVHELTHACLTHLALPLWIDEALAMLMEELVCGSNVFSIDREIYNKHVDHWNPTTIQQFWTGESWSLPDGGFDLSYNLAQILWRKIEGDLSAPRDAIFEFITTANWKDAGNKAFQTVFDLSLGDLVTDFIGEGDWDPKPSEWPKIPPKKNDLK